MPTPVLPLGRLLPWMLGLLGALLIAWGLLTTDREMVLAGAMGLAGVIVAFPVGAFITRDHHDGG